MHDKRYRTSQQLSNRVLNHLVVREAVHTRTTSCVSGIVWPGWRCMVEIIGRLSFSIANRSWLDSGP